MTLSRRQVLAGTSAAAFAALVAACTGRGDPRRPGPVGTVTERALKLLREAAEASPDHLAARAEELVEAKDANGLVALVRDRVAVIPWPANDYPEAARRWGSRATLRGAQGTPRDRAELLAWLLTRAGFAATVRVADRPAAITREGPLPTARDAVRA